MHPNDRRKAIDITLRVVGMIWPLSTWKTFLFPPFERDNFHLILDLTAWLLPTTDRMGIMARAGPKKDRG